MMKSKWLGWVVAILMTASMVLLGVVYIKPAVFTSLVGKVNLPYVTATDKDKVMDIQIVVDEQSWAQMLENARAEEYIPATIIINGQKISNVGIRPKGNSSLNMVAQDPTTDRYSFKIEFDQYIDGQTWLGLDKLVINNMQGDATYLKEYLSYDIMAYAGVDTPLYTFANVTVNNKPWGFYLAVEALDNSYAERVYGKDHGKLYKPESMGMPGGGPTNGWMNQAAPKVEVGGVGDALSGPNQPQAQRSGQAQQPVQTQRSVQGQPPGAATATNNTQKQAQVSGGQISAQNQAPTQAQKPQGDIGQAAPQGRPPQMAGENGQGWMAPGRSSRTSGGTTLQYTDDEISSYRAIFDSAVFKSSNRDYRRVINALKQLDAGENLDQVVDVEATLKYFAANTVLVNFDSYVSNMGHNYYLYEKDGQLTMLPWDFNLAFGGFQSGNASSVVNSPIDTPVSGVSLDERPILGRLLAVPEYLDMYHRYLQQIVDGYFTSGVFEQTIDKMSALIAPYVESDATAFYDYAAFQKGVAELKKLGVLRGQSIQGQLDGTIPATTAGQKATPQLLTDASTVNLAALGSMGGGGRIPGDRNRDAEMGAMPGPPDGNMPFRPDDFMANLSQEAKQQVFEILQNSAGNELTEAQVKQLIALGVNDEQVALLQGGPGGRFRGAPPGMGMPPNEGAPANNWQRNGPSSVSPARGYSAQSWIELLVCSISLVLGLLLVMRFKRRRLV